MGQESDLGGFRFRNRVTKRMVDPALDSGTGFYLKDSPFRFTKRSGFGGSFDNRFRFADYDIGNQSNLFRLRPISSSNSDAFRFNKRASIGNAGISSNFRSNLRQGEEDGRRYLLWRKITGKWKESEEYSFETILAKTQKYTNILNIPSTNRIYETQNSRNTNRACSTN